GEDASRLIETPIAAASLRKAPSDTLRFAATVAAYADALRGGAHIGEWEWEEVLESARASAGGDPWRAGGAGLGERAEGAGGGWGWGGGGWGGRGGGGGRRGSLGRTRSRVGGGCRAGPRSRCLRRWRRCRGCRRAPGWRGPGPGSRPGSRHPGRRRSCGRSSA